MTYTAYVGKRLTGPIPRRATSTRVIRWLHAMRWRKEPVHTLVAVKDIKRLTGLEPGEVLLLNDTQKLVRIDEKGRRVEFLRIPIELLSSGPEPEPED